MLLFGLLLGGVWALTGIVEPGGADVFAGDTNDGGMFGYDVSITDGSMNTTYLIVGKPWDASAYVFSAPTPQRTYAGGIPNVVNPPVWTRICQIYDTNNNTWTQGYANVAAPGMPSANSYALSYYGHSVDISNDAQFVAVGIPGRSDPANYSLETGSSYTQTIGYSAMIGEVRLYYSAGAGMFSANSYTALRRDPSVKGHFYKNKFGHQVRFSKDGQFLFVIANGGWDGTRAYYDGNFGCTDPNWTNEAVSPSRNMDGVGTHIYQRNGTSFGFWQFLQTTSLVPLGQQGLYLTTQGVGNATTFSVRTFLQNSASTATSGAIDHYNLNATSQFVLNTTVSKVPITASTPASGSYTNEDWFGQCVATVYEPGTDQLQMAISAPRDASVLYTYYIANYTTVGSGFTQGQVVSNEYYAATGKSYYGGALMFSPDAQFLFVADAATTTGRGMVHVYMKRVTNRVALGFESVAIPALPLGQTATSYAALNHAYDRLYSLVADAADYALSQGSSYTTNMFLQNSFGKAIAANQYWIVVGAPVSELVHTYLTPIAYQQIASAGTNSNQTTPVVTTPTTEGTSNKSALLYGIIGGLGVCLLALPAAFLSLRRRHRKELIARLEAQKALAALNANPWENPAAGGGDMEMQASNARLV